ncbi:unnamed protein product [Musa acuminata subsp. malaccensis]|uniref:(wild Malaysian banana) hypothetical protein n=1 Tax=Musa acuminata subsp. malaccensis TaxID=214687 RepID=A0A804J806_MUSAM|nr:PREDICTED: uncharacterized protein LOC103985557 [Musa acuminata subsp. malaccensis]XP_009401566.1 PREDICTED: uncharacterized protein LOC103985557 [Musa acuminata subsp. malaccensis]XP_009401567.1 PREDICTED: uncharacterized protein LOC103985557 [Musa acuminata subsp. malaccensis]XP_009401568.1 PREDICTED: uncharacterized protein LOC103985557 [Musa acuminata subsp. malaccensis]CAG1839442.1 unnamed protein product [Musa acuminata subsp. malaccensis]
MEEFLEHYNRDYVRNTMMKHQEIFRHQINELHRLYRVQKMIMAELGSSKFELQSHSNATSRKPNSDTSTADWISLSTSETCHASCVSDAHQFTDHINSDCRYMLPSGNWSGRSAKELMTRYEDPRRVSKGLDLEQPAEEFTFTEAWTIQDQALMFKKQLKDNSSKLKCPHNSWLDDESEIQLTLGIACGTDKRPSDFSASKF